MIEVADPVEHFRGVCRGMVEEAINIIKLKAEHTTETSVSQSQEKKVPLLLHI